MRNEFAKGVTPCALLCLADVTSFAVIGYNINFHLRENSLSAHAKAELDTLRVGVIH